ncbi:MAG: sulfite oxidase [Acidobacteriota bacterium]
MDEKRNGMRIMAERPLNAETPIERLRPWITANAVFFNRNQGEVLREPVDLASWELVVDGEVAREMRFGFERIVRMPKAIVADTLECSGNGRSLLGEKAQGNPWTVGGVGNAIWGGVWLRDLLTMAGLKPEARHVAFEGLESPLGSKGVKFIRSIPIEKAMSSTLLAYEMNGEPLPPEHGHPLRALALGWTGANCVKWLKRITVLDRPFEGFYMDQAYRVYQKGQEPKSGEVVTALKVKAIITQPLAGERLPKGTVTVLGAAFAGEADIERVDVSTDGGATWQPAEIIGPRIPYAWVQWQHVWSARETGPHVLLARATDSTGRTQPQGGEWNVLGYGNNGIDDHAVTVEIM